MLSLTKYAVGVGVGFAATVADAMPAIENNVAVSLKGAPTFYPIAASNCDHDLSVSLNAR